MPISSGACGVPNKYWNTPGQQAGNGAKWPSAREVNQGHRQGYPPHNPHSPPPPYRQEQEPQSGCCGRKSRTHHSQTRSHNNEGYRRGCCGPNAMYTTGVAGAGAGCCTGGMFGSRQYPFDPNNEYRMKGHGKSRCCACIVGLIIGLLLLALLLGLLLGLLPWLEEQENQKEVEAALPGGVFVDGIYYYPITDRPNRFIRVDGPGIPCNIYNNNSEILRPASDTVTNAFGNATESVTYGLPTTVPNCVDITTSIGPLVTFTLPPSPRDPSVVITPTSAAGSTTPLCCLWLTLIASVARQCGNYIN